MSSKVKYIPYTLEQELKDWIKAKPKRKKKGYSSKVHKNINAR